MVQQLAAKRDSGDTTETEIATEMYNVQQLHKNKNNEINGSSYCMQQLISPLWKSLKHWKQLNTFDGVHIDIPNAFTFTHEILFNLICIHIHTAM